MISLEDWALIRRLVADGVPRQAATQLGIGRAPVHRAVTSRRPPKYERKPVESTAFTPFGARVLAILDETPEMTATVIDERIGWAGSITWFRDNVRPPSPD